MDQGEGRTGRWKAIPKTNSLPYTLNHKWIRSCFPIRPSSRGSNKAPGCCRGLYFISGQTNHAFSEQSEFGSYRVSLLGFYTGHNAIQLELHLSYLQIDKSLEPRSNLKIQESRFGHQVQEHQALHLY